MTDHKYIYLSPVGSLCITASDTQVKQIRFCEECADTQPPRSQAIEEVIGWLDRYFKGDQLAIPSVISASGTSFQLKVWSLLLQIPYGKTVSYGVLADQLAADSPSGRMSAQAVGQAVGANPIAIIIPCHRVVGKNGNLTGYVGGLYRKQQLLKHEENNRTV